MIFFIMVGQNVSLVIYSLKILCILWFSIIQENFSEDVRIRFQENIQLSPFDDPILISYNSVYPSGWLNSCDTFITRTVLTFWVQAE